ncbi:MAG: TraR/DksA family transcriptional regulator [Acidimicrobiia bacterium]
MTDIEPDVASALEAHLQRALEAIEIALARITDDTFGRCADCGNRIPIDRLLAIPETARCVPCQSRSEGIPPGLSDPLSVGGN